MSDPSLIGLPGHEVMHIGPPVNVGELMDQYLSDFLFLERSRSRMGIVAPPGTPLRHRHDRAHANKLARHSKRPNGRPRHR